MTSRQAALSSHSPPRTILVMMVGDVGDVLLATPALRRLRAAYPQAHITAMTKPTTVAVLARSGLVDAFLPIEKQLFDRPTALLRPGVTLRLLRFVRELRSRRFEAVVLFQHLVTWWGTLKFGLLSLATGAPLRAGLDNGRGLFLTHAARDEGFDAAHESEYWLRVVGEMMPSPPTPLPVRGRGVPGPRSLGFPVRGRGVPGPRSLGFPVRGRGVPGPSAPAPLSLKGRGTAETLWHSLPSPAAGRGVGGEGLVPTFVVPEAAREAADALLREQGLAPGEPLLALHPGSGAYSTARRWFPERFAAVADELARRHGVRVVLLGGAEERELAAQVIGLMQTPAANLAGRTSLEELGAVLQRCTLLVGNDAGVAHLASAVGTPVVAIFGPFNHHTWHPLGRSLVVRADPPLPCMPCVNRGFSRGYPEGCPPRYCLREVTPAMVVAAAERLLAENRQDEQAAQPCQPSTTPAAPPA